MNDGNFFISTDRSGNIKPDNEISTGINDVALSTGTSLSAIRKFKNTESEYKENTKIHVILRAKNIGFEKEKFFKYKNCVDIFKLNQEKCE